MKHIGKAEFIIRYSDLTVCRDVGVAVPDRNVQSTTYKFGAERPFTFNFSLEITLRSAF